MTGALLATALFFAPAAVLELDQVLDEVGAAAPAVEVDRAAVVAARAAVGVAGAWQDPTVSITGEAFRFPGAMTEMSPMLTYRLSQELNLFGRRGAAKRQARATVAGREAVLRRTAWNARAQAAALFFDLWMSQGQAEILDRQISLMREMHQAALERVRAGMAMGHHDALRAEAAIARMEAERSSLDDERAAMAAMLNTLRGRADDLSVPRVALPRRRAIPPFEPIAGKAGGTPEVSAARAMRSEAEAGREVAEKMYLPMVSLEAMYAQRLEGERDTWGGGVMFSIPLWWRDRQRSEVAMAEAMIARARREELAMRQMASAELRMAWSRLRAADRRVTALEERALPSMRESVASTRSGYVAGRIDFLVLLESLTALLELEMERLEAVVDRATAELELERVAGDRIEERRR
jgi:cobalt-zinc-cadmium efflux system outer membrane protein